MPESFAELLSDNNSDASWVDSGYELVGILDMPKWLIKSHIVIASMKLSERKASIVFQHDDDELRFLHRLLLDTFYS